MRILLLPLDGRPCNTALPRAIAAIASHEVVVPPPALLGGPGRAADIPGILAFLRREGPSADAVVASLDLLVHGGLEASRDSALELDVALTRADHALEALRPFAAYLTTFTAIPGTEAAREATSPLTDHEIVRRRNSAVNLRFAAALKRGAIARVAYVHDTPETAGAPEADLAELRAATEGLDALFLSGADGAGALLTAAAILDETAPVLRLGVLVSDAPGMGRQALYEREPFRETFHSHLRSLGLVVDNENPEVQLCVHPPASRPKDFLFDGAAGDSPDLDDFVEKICQGVTAGRTLVLADCAHANGADPVLMEALPKATLGGLAGFGAWSTASNTLSSVLAQASMIAWARRQRCWNAPASIRWTQRSILDDWLYQSIVRRQLVELCQQRGIDRFALGDAAPEFEEALNLRLQQLARERLPFGSPRFHAKLPWARLTEIDVEWPA